MEVVADFFVDSLVVPFYFYLAAYGIMWIIVFFLARLFIGRDPVEQAAKKAWGIGLVLHLLGGTALIVWITIRAVPRVSELWHVPFLSDFLYNNCYCGRVLFDIDVIPIEEKRWSNSIISTAGKIA